MADPHKISGAPYLLDRSVPNGGTDMNTRATARGHCKRPRRFVARSPRAAFDELADKWGARYPAVVRLWNNAWDEFIPFLDYGACRRFADWS